MYKLLFNLKIERRKPNIQKGYKRKWTLTNFLRHLKKICIRGLHQ